MTTVEMAEKYYPALWDEKRLAMLVNAGRLTQEDAERILGKVSKVGTQGRG